MAKKPSKPSNFIGNRGKTRIPPQPPIGMDPNSPSYRTSSIRNTIIKSIPKSKKPKG